MLLSAQAFISLALLLTILLLQQTAASYRHGGNAMIVDDHDEYYRRRKLQATLPSLTHELSIVVIYSYSTVPADSANSICDLFIEKVDPYIIYSLEHLALIQKKANIILVSNIGVCSQTLIDKRLKHIGVTYFDTKDFINIERQRSFNSFSGRLVPTKANGTQIGHLWLSSTLRFLILEDLMIKYGLRSVIHIEADNLLLGDLSTTTVLQTLKTGYSKTLAASPLYLKSNFITAGIFWTPSSIELHEFTEFIIDTLGRKEGQFQAYLKFLRVFACCKVGGLDPDSKGYGVFPYAVNEMTLLGYFKRLNPTLLVNFPVLPRYPYGGFACSNDDAKCDLSHFMIGSHRSGPPLGTGIFDSGSWGQYLGGVDTKSSDTRGFRNSKHVIGAAMEKSTCKPAVFCVSMEQGFNLMEPIANKSTRLRLTKIMSRGASSITKLGLTTGQGITPANKPSHVDENEGRFPFLNETEATLLNRTVGYQQELGISNSQNRWSQLRQLLTTNSALDGDPESNQEKSDTSSSSPHLPVYGRTMIAISCVMSARDHRRMASNFSGGTRATSQVFRKLGAQGQGQGSISTFTPLWNLHVHSKLTWEFLTNTCLLRG